MWPHTLHSRGHATAPLRRNGFSTTRNRQRLRHSAGIKAESTEVRATHTQLYTRKPPLPALPTLVLYHPCLATRDHTCAILLSATACTCVKLTQLALTLLSSGRVFLPCPAAACRTQCVAASHPHPHACAADFTSPMGSGAVCPSAPGEAGCGCRMAYSCTAQFRLSREGLPPILQDWNYVSDSSTVKPLRLREVSLLTV